MRRKIGRFLPAAMFFMAVLNICSTPTLAVDRLQLSKITSPSATELELTAQVNKDEEGAFVLEWTLRNSSNRDLLIGNTNSLTDYVIEVTDRQNKPVRLTDAGQKLWLASRMISRKPPIVLHPGDEMTNRIVLSEIYDLKRNGVYAVIVKRRFGTVVVKSNPARVRVSS
ncbi:MAG TPA: hypothetical protein VFR12_00935 [Pyrinomonadaceae bacterium]|nr:hypothetical protein [Pyrinomonadaceae bacterium]